MNCLGMLCCWQVLAVCSLSLLHGRLPRHQSLLPQLRCLPRNPSWDLTSHGTPNFIYIHISKPVIFYHMRSTSSIITSSKSTQDATIVNFKWTVIVQYVILAHFKACYFIPNTAFLCYPINLYVIIITFYLIFECVNI